MPTIELGLVDTNILVYLADATDLIKHEKAKKFLNQIIKNPEFFVTSLQNLRESCSVLVSKKQIKKQELEEYFTLLLDAFEAILYDIEEDVLAASKICLDKKTSFWDSLLAQTMKRNKIGIIYTENTKDFKQFEGINTINPLV